MNYEVVPNIITGKDLDYLSDMFNWNYGSYKNTCNSIEKVNDKEIKDVLIKQVQNIKKSSSKISVKEKMSIIDKYYKKENWDAIAPINHKEILYSLVSLIDNEINVHPLTLSFDLRMLRIEKELLLSNSINRVSHIVKVVRELCKVLLDYAAIEEVQKNAEYIVNLYNGNIWNNPTIEELEFHRKKVRDLMKYIPKVPKYIAITNIEDETIDLDNPIQGVIDIRTYQEKVLDYLLEDASNPTLIKIKRIEPLNEDDFKELEKILWVKTGTKDDYYQITKIDNLAVFIRSMVGIEQEAVNEKFGEFLNDNYLTAEQQEFIYSIINYVRENGDIELQNIIDESPFDNYDILDLFGEKVAIVSNVVNTIHKSVI